jgi:Putative GTP-binding controlling metal-binding
MGLCSVAPHVCRAACRVRVLKSLDTASEADTSGAAIVACLDRPVLLRPGALPRADIERVVALAEATPSPASPASVDEVPIAPGALPSHYAPRARLRLDAQRVEAHEALLRPDAGGRRARLRIFVVRCSLPCDPPVGGHSCNGGMIPRFHRVVSDSRRQVAWAASAILQV